MPHFLLLSGVRPLLACSVYVAMCVGSDITHPLLLVTRSIMQRITGNFISWECTAVCSSVRLIRLNDWYQRQNVTVICLYLHVGYTHLLTWGKYSTLDMQLDLSLCMTLCSHNVVLGSWTVTNSDVRSGLIPHAAVTVYWELWCLRSHLFIGFDLDHNQGHTET